MRDGCNGRCRLEPGTDPQRHEFDLFSDYELAFFKAVQYLTALDHRRFGLVSGPLCYRRQQQIENGFLRGVSEFALDFRPGEWSVRLELKDDIETVQSAVEFGRKLFSGKEFPSAIVCSDGRAAKGILYAACEAGLKVPEDLSVFACSSRAESEQTFPPVSSIAWNAPEAIFRGIYMPVTLCGSSGSEYSTSSLLVHSAARALPSRLKPVQKIPGASLKYCPPPLTVDISRSMVSGYPDSRDIASRCSTLFVEPPRAISMRSALNTASLVMISRAVRPSRRRCIIFMPVSLARRLLAENTAGIVPFPGSAIPRASVMQFIVFAVYIPEQLPQVGQQAISISASSSAVMGQPERYRFWNCLSKN